MSDKWWYGREEEFIALFPHYTNVFLQHYFGAPKLQDIANRAYAWRLKKSKAHISRMRGLPNKGKPRSEETKKKLSAALKGFQWPEEVVKRRTATLLKSPNKYAGKRHIWYRHGNARTRFKDERYAPWRMAVLRKGGMKCQKCGFEAKNKVGKGLHAHHIFPFHDYPDKRYDINNGVALCADCHYGMHKKINRLKKQGVEFPNGFYI